MINLKKYLEKVIIFFCFSFMIFFFSFIQLSADEIRWIEVARSNDEFIFIDSNSIKYNNRGLLSVLIKHSEINPNDQEVKNINSYLMAIDCDNRLFSKLPVNREPNQVKNWEKPLNDKMIKKVIINSCSY